MQRITIAGFLLLLSLPALAVDSRDMNQSISISYGVVESVERKKVDSAAPGGAVLGGIIGAATSGHHHRGKHAAIGAVSGGVLTAILQGNRDAYAYQVKMVSGGEKQIMTEQNTAREGDCVAVEEGRLANIRRVSSAHCEHHDHAATQGYLIHSKSQESAAECHVAKEAALQADTEEEMDIALKKVQIFCD